MYANIYYGSSQDTLLYYNAMSARLSQSTMDETRTNAVSPLYTDQKPIGPNRPTITGERRGGWVCKKKCLENSGGDGPNSSPIRAGFQVYEAIPSRRHRFDI